MVVPLMMLGAGTAWPRLNTPSLRGTATPSAKSRRRPVTPSRHPRSNCVVLAGMGACARAEPDSTDTELKVRIGPVARVTAGDLLMWPGPVVDLHMEEVTVGETSLQ